MSDVQMSEQELAELPRWAKAKYLKAADEIETYKKRLTAVEEEVATHQEAKRRSKEELIARRKADDAKHLLALHRENVAMKYGIPNGHRHRLIGNTREELERDAESLLDLFG
jgi:hypothetical protein